MACRRTDTYRLLNRVITLHRRAAQSPGGTYTNAMSCVFGLDAGIFLAETLDLGNLRGDDTWLIQLFAFVRHITLEAGVRKQPPHAVHVDRGCVIKRVSNVSVGGVWNACGNLGIGILGRGRHEM